MRKNKIKILIIGSGSNILAADKGLKQAVINLSAPFFKRLEAKGNMIEAGAGVQLNKLLNFAKNKGLSGLEFLVGIPGTVGGALTMNAGAHGAQIGNLVAKVKVMDYNNKIKLLRPEEINFSYRNSRLAKYIVLSAHLKLTFLQKDKIGERLAAFAVYRKQTQPYRYPSAGCVFKNPGHESAGKLIDACGLKGKRAGGAVISEQHANFIVNKDHALSRDVLKLISLAQKKVYAKFKIKLKPEIRIWN